MKTLKENEVLNGRGEPVPVSDWYGNPIPADKIPRAQEGVKGERGADGRLYLRPWSADGKPGKRVPLEDSYLLIRDDNGKVVYDYSVWPPAAANIQPGYVGYIFEEILKSYFGESYADAKKAGNAGSGIAAEDVWMETTEDGQKYWRWNIVWQDRWEVENEKKKPFKPRYT